MDLEGVRTFVAVAETGQFQEAAARLSVTQQAVSKRVAALEAALGVRLFVRTPRGAQLTPDGQVFLPHARELLAAEERAVNSVRPDRRPLRVDVLSTQIGPGRVVREFHSAHAEVEIRVVTHLFDVEAALAALRSGAIDATFRAVTRPAEQLAGDIEAVRVLDDPLELLTSHAHALAMAASVTPAELAAHRIWMPSNVPGTEWSSYYEELSASFGVRIDTAGPNFGMDTLLEAIAGSSTLATLVGEHIKLVWPPEYDLRRIPIREPMVVYPHSLLWRSDNAHPGLAKLRGYLCSRADRYRHPQAWTPRWANR
ncbi:LysR family transcriptional regulator [Chondromyces apiculatus]|uniref:Transcriptional regulator, LysR family n=1 Tax=Chondromyces apiculatus DSM 436 TaxID=1192034 RepID=A0A017T1Y9_9BACT|nr:LysR family transcriptional regulator [Chondromyces apiculatus]EYF03253.1 Transcriptional regulator, LysR family [Chondromyces apiculatus DSM 436]